jgi:ribosome biogenesis protein YTM1
LVVDLEVWRIGLSVRWLIEFLIGHAAVAETPQPFDFLVDGELLRTSVEQFLLTKGITAVSLSMSCSLLHRP